MDASPGQMYAVASTMLVLAVVPVALRFYVRIQQKQRLLVDDWLIVVALIAAIGTAAAIYDATALGGLGGHTEITSQGIPLFTDQLEILLKANFVTLLTQTIGFGMTKLSVLFFYRRLFREKKAFNIVSWIMIGVTCMWTIAFFFAQLLQCLPINANWTGAADASDAVCINELPMYISGAWFDVFTDLIILALPIPVIWSLQMSTERKIAVSGIFLLGAFIARLVIYYEVEAEMNAGGLDVAWILAPTFTWPMIETGLGILGACLPILRPVFQGVSLDPILRSFRRSSLNSGRSSSNATVVEKRDPGSVYTVAPSAPFNFRKMGDDGWSNHSDEVVYGYHADVSARGYSPKRGHEMV